MCASASRARSCGIDCSAALGWPIYPARHVDRSTTRSRRRRRLQLRPGLAVGRSTLRCTRSCSPRSGRADNGNGNIIPDLDCLARREPDLFDNSPALRQLPLRGIGVRTRPHGFGDLPPTSQAPAAPIAVLARARAPSTCHIGSAEFASPAMGLRIHGPKRSPKKRPRWSLTAVRGQRTAVVKEKCRPDLQSRASVERARHRRLRDLGRNGSSASAARDG